MDPRKVLSQGLTPILIVGVNNDPSRISRLTAPAAIGERSGSSWLSWVALVAALLVSGCKHFQPVPLAADEAAGNFDARSMADLEFKAFLEKNLGHAVAPWPLPSWDFPTLTLAAFYFHPSLAVARAQWNVAKAGVVTAGGHPNPVVTVTPGYNFSAASGVSPWMPSVNLDVPIETAGKRGHRLARARQLSESARLNIAAAAWQVRSALRLSLVEFAAASRQITLLEGQREIQQQLALLLEQRLASGAASATEVTPARIALIKSAADLGEARRRKVEARARVAEAAGLPLRALEQADLYFDLSAGSEIPKELSSTDLRHQALRNRPDLLASLSEYAAAQSALQLEIARQYPDVHIGSGYQWDQGESKWSLGLSLELPVRNRNQGPIAEAEAKRAEVAARFVALQARVLAEIDRAVANHAAVQDQLREGDQLVQTQQKQLQSIAAALQAGGADQLDLRTGQAEAALGELARLDMLVKTQLAVGQVEDALQRPFDALGVIEHAGSGPERKEQP